MNVFVMIHHDRHSDDEIIVYADKTDAITEAQKRVRDFARGEFDETPKPYHSRCGIVYRGDYGPEGDHVRVEEKALQTNRKTEK